MSGEYKDRFSEATEELPEKNAFFCKTCNTKYSKKDAEKKELSCCNRTLTELLQEGFGP